MKTLDKCTLCDDREDPRFNLLTREGVFYPLCDRCAPLDDDLEHVSEIADLCRAKGPGRSEGFPFGFTER
jgi:hypothetical protein